MKKVTKELAQTVADELIGSGCNIEDYSTMYDVDYFELAIFVEELGVWRCETCDWWVDISETVNGECNDCSSLHDDE